MNQLMQIVLGDVIGAPLGFAIFWFAVRPALEKLYR